MALLLPLPVRGEYGIDTEYPEILEIFGGTCGYDRGTVVMCVSTAVAQDVKSLEQGLFAIGIAGKAVIVLSRAALGRAGVAYV